MYKNKNVLVCGMGRSGQSAALLLIENGANVTVQDTRADIAWENSHVQYYLGKNPDDIVQNFDLIVISPGISIYEPFVKKANALNIPVWGEVELAYSLCPSPKNIIAITGTNGKTTVTTLVGEIMKTLNPTNPIGGNIGIPLTDFIANVSEENIITAEISSFQLETIEDFTPKVSAILNITEDHIDRHLTMENYIATKARIFENQKPHHICVLNYDNLITRNMNPPCQKVYFSAKEILDTGVFIQNSMVVAKMPNATGIEIGSIAQLKNATMVENVLAVVAIALAAGAAPQDIFEHISGFKGVAHRLEKIRNIDGVKYINDSKATNTDSGIKAIEAIEGPIVLIAGGYDKNTDFTPWVRSFNGKVTDLIVIGATTAQIIETCNQVGFSRYCTATTLEEAIDLAKEKAVVGGHVLFSPACASFDMFKNFEARGDAFRAYVERSL